MTYPLALAKTRTALRPRRALVTSALALSLAGGILGGPALVAAQDGTQAATPTPPSACKIVPAGAETATPASAAVATPVASPVAALASPVAENPAQADLQAAATAIAGCLSDANYETLSQMTSDLFRGQLFGTSAPMDAATFAELAPALPHVAYQIITVDEVAVAVDGTATAHVVYEMAHQVRSSIWTFAPKEVGGQKIWTLTSETAAPLTLPEGTTSVSVELKDNAYKLSESTVQGPSVALEGKNTDKVDHEMLVLRFDKGVDTDALLKSYGPSLPKGVTFVGQAIIPAGQSGTLLLAGLQPGTYTIVCLLPDANGTPHLVDGMQTTLTVK